MIKRKRLFFSGLNELRAIAALAVLFHHVELYKHRLKIDSLYGFGSNIKSFISDLGINGVLIFFVLSGFLITYLLIEEKEETGNISVIKFYGRRILRIWPLYLVILIAGFCFSPFLYENFNGFFEGQDYYNGLIEELVYGPNLLLYLFFMSNFALAIYGPVAGASQSWSVSVEEQFYLVWPWVVKLFYSKLLIVLIIIVVLGVLFKDVFSDNIITKIYNISRIDFMAMGAMIAYGYKFHKARLVLVVKNKTFIFLLAISVIIHLFYTVFNFTKALTFGLLIVSCIECKFFNRALDTIGKLSYVIYMYHPVMMYISFSIMNKLQIENLIFYNLLIYLMILCFTFVISYFSYYYYYFESYFLKIRTKLSPIPSGNNK